jgi:hypothetical protein
LDVVHRSRMAYLPRSEPIPSAATMHRHQLSVGKQASLILETAIGSCRLSHHPHSQGQSPRALTGGAAR